MRCFGGGCEGGGGIVNDGLINYGDEEVVYFVNLDYIYGYDWFEGV